MPLARQVACSDVILLNKCDLASPILVEETESIIKSINSSVAVHKTVMGQIELSVVLGLDALRSRPSLDLTLQTPRVINHSHHSHDDADTCECSTHADIRGITTCTVPLPPLQKSEEASFDAWVRRILWEGTASDNEATEPPMEILRAKGIYWTHAGDQVILQAVRMLYELQRLPSEGEAREGKLVLIGKSLRDATRLSESLAYHLSRTM